MISSFKWEFNSSRGCACVSRMMYSRILTHKLGVSASYVQYLKKIFVLLSMPRMLLSNSKRITRFKLRKVRIAWNLNLEQQISRNERFPFLLIKRNALLPLSLYFSKFTPYHHYTIATNVERKKVASKRYVPVKFSQNNEEEKWEMFCYIVCTGYWYDISRRCGRSEFLIITVGQNYYHASKSARVLRKNLSKFSRMPERVNEVAYRGVTHPVYYTYMYKPYGIVMTYHDETRI